jgi:3-mercaptopyruvate sulfurtransferase SseA
MTDPFVALADLPRLTAPRYVAAGAPTVLPGAVEAPRAAWIAAAREPGRGFADAGFWEAQIDALGLDGPVTAVVCDDRPHDGGGAGRDARFDSRTEAEHRGEDRRANRRGGRLPGAALPPHATLMEGGRMRDAAALRATLAEAGLAPRRPVATRCNGGGCAALAAAAALRAGYDAVSVYYLSVADWAADESCPIERPRRLSPSPRARPPALRCG